MPEIVNPYIVGLGGHAQVVASILLARGITPAGFLDALEPSSNPRRSSLESICGLPILGNLEYLVTRSGPQVFVAVGDNHKRAKLVERLRRLIPTVVLPVLRYPSAIVEYGATIGTGCQLCAAAVLCVNASIGEGTIINTGASVDHECRIGRYCHISPGAHLAGRTTVGDFTHIGIGAVVIEKIHIGSNVTVGAGAVVIADIPDNVIVVGNPARIIKTIFPDTTP